MMKEYCCQDFADEVEVNSSIGIIDNKYCYIDPDDNTKLSKFLVYCPFCRRKLEPFSKKWTVNPDSKILTDLDDDELSVIDKEINND